MTWAAVAVVGGSILGGVISSSGARSAAQTQANAANNATAAQQQMFEETRGDQAPWRQAGQTALSQIAGMGDYFNHQFNASDLNANLAPGYEFMKQQGLGAATNASNLYSPGGNTLKAITDYAENYALNGYQQAFANYTSNQTNIFNRLASIAGLGQTAGSNQTTGGSAYGNSIGNAMMGAGNAQAAGIVGSANAWNGMLSSPASWYGLNNLFGQPSGTQWATVGNPGSGFEPGVGPSG